MPKAAKKQKKTSNEYREPSNCYVCGKDFLARYNFVGRARVCTPPDHKCEPGKKKLHSGTVRIISCVKDCCRSKYRKSAAQQMMDNPIDERKFLSDSQFSSVMKGSRKVQDPFGVAIRFIGAIGCRLSEALLVRVSGLRLDSQIPAVKVPTLKRVGRPVRTVHLYDLSFVKELRALAKDKKPGEILFPCAKRTLQRHFTNVVKKCGLKKDSGIHILRHTKASQLLAAGADPNYVRQQLGWSSLSMLTVYAHVDEEKLGKMGKSLPKIR